MKHLLKKFGAGSLLLALLFVSPLVKGQNALTYTLTGMTAHVGQLCELRIIDTTVVPWNEIVRLKFDTVPSAILGFNAQVVAGGYYVDFYADFDSSGGYTFPGDHAWRETLVKMAGDTQVVWAHNLNFTDIMWPAATGIKEYHPNITKVQIFPNPVRGAFNLNLVLTDHEKVMIKIFSVEGKLVFARHLGSITGHYSIELNLSDQSAGLYHLQIITDKGTVSKEVVIK